MRPQSQAFSRQTDRFKTRAEHATDRLLRDLAAVCEPQRMTVTLDYKVRGGLHTVTMASYDARD